MAAVRKYYAGLGFFDATVTPTVEYSKDHKSDPTSNTQSTRGLAEQPARPLNGDTKNAAAVRVAQAAPAPETRSLPLSKMEPMQPAPDDDELRKLQKERYNAALRELKLNEYQDQLGTIAD